MAKSGGAGLDERGPGQIDGAARKWDRPKARVHETSCDQQRVLRHVLERAHRLVGADHDTPLTSDELDGVGVALSLMRPDEQTIAGEAGDLMEVHFGFSIDRKADGGGASCCGHGVQAVAPDGKDDVAARQPLDAHHAT